MLQARGGPFWDLFVLSGVNSTVPVFERFGRRRKSTDKQAEKAEVPPNSETSAFFPAQRSISSDYRSLVRASLFGLGTGNTRFTDKINVVEAVIQV